MAAVDQREWMAAQQQQQQHEQKSFLAENGPMYASPPQHQLASADDHDAVLMSVAKALAVNLKKQSEVTSELLDDKNALTTTANLTFTWKKAEASSDGAAAAGAGLASKSRSAAGLVPHTSADRTQAKPQDIKFSAKALNAMFKGSADMSKDQHVLSVSILEYANPTPFPLALHLDNIQGGSVHKEFAEDGSPAAFVMLPRSKSELPRELYRMTNVNERDLMMHGTASLHDEMSELVPIPGTGKILVSPEMRLGRIIEANWHDLSTEPLQFVAHDVPFYAVHESIVKHVLDAFNKDVIQTLAKTRFTDHVVRLTRADRTADEATKREFGDASDAANTSKSALDAAHGQKQAVHVKIEYKLIDPSKLVPAKKNVANAGTLQQ